MLIEKTDKELIKKISTRMSKRLIKHPLFMFFCKDINKRGEFITDYFRYYLPEWIKSEMLFVNKDCTVVISAVNPENFEFKYKGLSAYRMKKYEFSSNVFVHRENLEDICDILLSYRKPVLILTLYASYDTPEEDIMEVVREIKQYADKNDVTLLYDTFSRRLISSMTDEGFIKSYSKQFIATQYTETIMLYNV